MKSKHLAANILREPYTFTYPVFTFLTDHRDRLTAANLANFLQDIAGRHAMTLGWAVEDLHNAGTTWVLSRIYVEIHHLPMHMKNVIVKTWPTGGERLFAYRDFEVHTEDGQLVAKGRSAWVVMNLETRRPLFVPEEVKNMAGLYPEPAVQFPERKVPGATKAEICLPIKVRMSDLDRNIHVNNVRFIEWAMESVSADFYDRYDVATMDVVFRSEVRKEDEVRVEMEQHAESTHHTIYKNDKPACLLAITWQARVSGE